MKLQSVRTRWQVGERHWTLSGDEQWILARHLQAYGPTGRVASVLVATGGVLNAAEVNDLPAVLASVEGKADQPIEVSLNEEDAFENPWWWKTFVEESRVRYRRTEIKSGIFIGQSPTHGMPDSMTALRGFRALIDTLRAAVPEAVARGSFEVELPLVFESL